MRGCIKEIIKTVVEREYKIHASNVIINTGITEANIQMKWTTWQTFTETQRTILSRDFRMV